MHPVTKMAIAALFSFTFSMAIIGYFFGDPPQTNRRAHDFMTSAVHAPTYALDIIPVSEAPTYDISEWECMRLNVFFEARNQSVNGMKAVALITMNRVNNVHYPDTVCDVVFQGRKDANGNLVRNRCQFSWACDGNPNTPRLHNPIEQAAWEIAGNVADRVMRGEVENFLGRATHYHANYVNPDWSRASRFRRVAVIDKHIFYRDTYIANAVHNTEA